MPRRSVPVLALSAIAVAAWLVSTPPAAAARNTPPLRGDFGQNFRLAETPTAAPETSFMDQEGLRVSLASFGGRVVLLNFWATGCQPCIEQLASLDRLQARLGSKGLSVIAVSVDKGGPVVAAPFLQEQGIGNLTSYSDPNSELMNSFGIRDLPSSVLIGADGQVDGVMMGATRWDSDDAIALVRHYLGLGGDPSESFYALAIPDEPEPESASDAYARGDYAAAYRLWRPAAEAGNAEAQFSIAVLFDHGFGVSQDKVRAAQWYGQAAQRGHADASYNLAVMLVDGEGIPRDYALAHLFFDLAAGTDPAAAEPRDALAAAMSAEARDQAEALAERARGDDSARVLREALATVLPALPTRDLIRQVQEGLARRGYDPGGADGIAGPKTRAAVRAYQSEAGLAADGEVSEALLTLLRSAGE